MPEKIRFLLDEHIPAAVAAGLKRKGIIAATVHELGRSGFSDADHLQLAFEEGWVLVTFDSDFLVLARQDKPHAGFVWCAERKFSIGQLIRALASLYALVDREGMQNQVVFL